jgi:thioesterase domain-containing protein
VTTFGLVHGAWHGAWCWDLVAEELRGKGHRVVAVDLPCEDPAAGAEEYARVTIDAITAFSQRERRLEPDVVLVGHSTGGLTIPVVAERLATLGRPVRGLVFLAPLLPQPGRSSDQLQVAEPDRLMPGFGAGQLGHGDGSSTWQPQAAIATLYPDAPPRLAEWAAERLRRQYWQVTREITPLKAWPGAHVTVIACAADAVVNPDWVRRTTGVQFGVEAHVLPGDHSPFLTRPSELADLLLAS